MAVAAKAAIMPEATAPPIGLRNISGNLEAAMAASKIAKEAKLKTTPIRRQDRNLTHSSR